MSVDEHTFHMQKLSGSIAGNSNLGSSCLKRPLFARDPGEPLPGREENTTSDEPVA